MRFSPIKYAHTQVHSNHSLHGTLCAEYSNDAIQVTQLPYPIKAKPLGKFRYFQKVFSSGCFNTF